MTPASLFTTRLELVATTLAHLEAELRDPGSLAGLLGAAVPADWPPGDYDRHAMEYFHERLSAGGPAAAGWYGWYGITRAAEGGRATLIAAAGYLGPPAGGQVEIGFSVLAAARGRGYAAEMVAALVARAFAEPGVTAVIAHAAEDNTASRRVLERCGLRPDGAGEEPGTLRFRLAKADLAPTPPLKAAGQP
jgi:RimJ/RimL family protein N-acetyltransferase